MKRVATLLFFSVLLPVTAAGPADFAHWRSSELKAYGKKLAPKINELKFAVEQIATYGNCALVVVHREGDGEAEVHENGADVFVVQDGEGTLVVGGKVVGARKTGEGEIRGASIEGGEKRPLGPGDIAHIPVNVPHQVLLPPGKQITYVIVKVPK
jgi:mannose-6-phosphate isomerase-like protein (cupin superfamily)